MKAVLLTLFLCFFLTGCEYFEIREFILINKTTEEIRIRTEQGSDHLFFSDTLYILQPNEQIKFSEDMGMTGKDMYAEDYFSAGDLLPDCTRFDIYIADTLVREEIRRRPNWLFESQKGVGTYILEITNELLQE